MAQIIYKKSKLAKKREILENARHDSAHACVPHGRGPTGIFQPGWPTGMAYRAPREGRGAVRQRFFSTD